MLGEFAVDEAVVQRSISNEVDAIDAMPTEWKEFLKVLAGDRRAAVLERTGEPQASRLQSATAETSSAELSPERRTGETPAVPVERRTLPATRLWVAAERLPQLQAVFPSATLEPLITAPASFTRNHLVIRRRFG